MKIQEKTAAALAVLAIGAAGATVARAQSDHQVSSPMAIHEQTAKHLKQVVDVLDRLGTPETPFDYIAPAVSGPVVVLEGFTANGGLRNDAMAKVKTLPWVVDVVDEIDYLRAGPNLRQTRQQALQILVRLLPQAFPENHANIRIKVTKDFDVTLIGIAPKGDKKELEAAVEQIRHLELVQKVDNQVIEAD
jgi:hypothetical protein